MIGFPKDQLMLLVLFWHRFNSLISLDNNTVSFKDIAVIYIQKDKEKVPNVSFRWILGGGRELNQEDMRFPPCQEIFLFHYGWMRTYLVLLTPPVWMPLFIL